MTNKTVNINSKTRPQSDGEVHLIRRASKIASEQRIQKVGERAVALLAITGVGVGIGVALNRQDSNAHKAHLKTEQQALEAINSGEQESISAWNSVVVLRAGTAIRNTPTEGDEVSTHVKQGEVWRIDRPRTYTDDSNRLWLAFTSADKGSSDGGATETERTYWVNYDALHNLNTSKRRMIDVYDYSDKSFPNLADNKPLLSVTVDSTNHAAAQIGKGDVLVGQVSAMPEHVFQHMVQQEDLQIDRTK